MGSWGEQFTAGDQGERKKLFWQSGFKKCPQCTGADLKTQTHCAGCRHNGDGYGTETFECNTCSWNTSFQYDDAGSPYYYETRNWEMPKASILVQQSQVQFTSTVNVPESSSSSVEPTSAEERTSNNEVHWVFRCGGSCC